MFCPINLKLEGNKSPIEVILIVHYIKFNTRVIQKIDIDAYTLERILLIH